MHPNQVAYAKNRLIGENIRTVDENIYYKKMKHMHWPKSFINMMKLLYNGIENCVSNNGTSSPYFEIKRDVRQGDPISALSIHFCY